MYALIVINRKNSFLAYRRKEGRIYGVKMAPLKELEKNLHHLTVADLRENAAANAIVRGQIRETDEGFILTFDLSWRNDNTLYTRRDNRPRTWKSLDRLMAFLKEEQINQFIKNFELL